jgi:hypothetical protein
LHDAPPSLTGERLGRLVFLHGSNPDFPAQKGLIPDDRIREDRAEVKHKMNGVSERITSLNTNG